MMTNDDYLVDDKVNQPATIEDLKQIIKILNKHKIPYLLIGGYALMLQGSQRVTKDIDIMLPFDKEVGIKVKKALSELPEKAADRIKDDWFDEDDTIRVADKFTIDLLFKCANGEYNYKILSQYEEIKELDGIKIKTINPEGLWYSKQTGRDKDNQDLIFLNSLLKANGISMYKEEEQVTYELPQLNLSCSCGF